MVPEEAEADLQMEEVLYKSKSNRANKRAQIKESFNALKSLNIEENQEAEEKKEEEAKKERDKAKKGKRRMSL